MKRRYGILWLMIPLLGIVFLTGCKTEEEADTGAQYDITGTWQVTTTWASLGAPRPAAPGTYAITFEGSASNGIFSTGSGDVGTYLVVGSVVQWMYSFGTVYTGVFTDETSMEGQMVGGYGATGTWTAVKSNQGGS